MVEPTVAPPDDEPRSPMWLPALGATLFLGLGLWWAVTPSSQAVASQAPSSATSAGASAAAAQPAPSAAPQPKASAAAPASAPLPSLSAGTAPQRMPKLRNPAAGGRPPPHP